MWEVYRVVYKRLVEFLSRISGKSEVNRGDCSPLIGCDAPEKLSFLSPVIVYIVVRGCGCGVCVTRLTLTSLDYLSYKGYYGSAASVLLLVLLGLLGVIAN